MSVLICVKRNNKKYFSIHLIHEWAQVSEKGEMSVPKHMQLTLLIITKVCCYSFMCFNSACSSIVQFCSVGVILCFVLMHVPHVGFDSPQQ